MSKLSDLLIGIAVRYADENNIELEEAIDLITAGKALQDKDILELEAYANGWEVQKF